MHFVFRVDASSAIGSGHVMRCLTLAQALVARGASASFICREQDGHLCDVIAARGFAVRRLAPLPANGVPFTAVGELRAMHDAWEYDARATQEAIKSDVTRADWLVVDHYALDEKWERFVRLSVGHIMVIDDTADRPHVCDLLLDQNLVADMVERYAAHVPAGCAVLLGPRYALLQSTYAELHDRVPPREGPIRRVFVFVGAADTANVTGRIVGALLDLQYPDLQIDVVVAATSPYVEAVRERVAGYSSVRLHSGLPTLAPLMARADLAIGASGAASWERLSLGLPAIVVTLAENQRAIAAELHRRKLVQWLGDQEVVDERAIGYAVRALLDRTDLSAWSQACRAVVDGRGATRVCAVLLASESTPLRTRDAKLSDLPYLSAWWAQPTTGAHCATMDSRSVEDAERCLRDCLREIEHCRLLVVENEDGETLGVVCFSHERDMWRVQSSLAPQLLAPGLETRVREAAMLHLRAQTSGLLRFRGEDAPSGGPYEPVVSRWRIGICSDMDSWINKSLPEMILHWCRAGHSVAWVHDAAELPAGDICFYLSYGRIVGSSLLRRFRNNLVVHASDLPKGRGWSPLTWQVLEGCSEIPVTLFEAADSVDSGPVYGQERISLDGSELISELRAHVAKATTALCSAFVDSYPNVAETGVPQAGQPTFYRRRRPVDSRIDIDRPLRDQFNLLRTVDPDRYPAWFEYQQKRFTVNIKKHDA
jgi:UDP-2,4-diacetamido-2,4,6-trideoxy-beta-L-altropyranose hydrolase